MDTTHATFCPYYHQAVELIGRRWTGAILRELLHGRCRFSDLRNSIPGLSDRLLSERLRELESEGIVSRKVYPEVPVRIEYRLTEKGLALQDAVAAISEWADTWLRSGEVIGDSLEQASTKPAESPVVA